jgi:FlaA1/EpsC-like NDP-sugar epimerase
MNKTGKRQILLFIIQWLAYYIAVHFGIYGAIFSFLISVGLPSIFSMGIALCIIAVVVYQITAFLGYLSVKNSLPPTIFYLLLALLVL